MRQSMQRRSKMRGCRAHTLQAVLQAVAAGSEGLAAQTAHLVAGGSAHAQQWPERRSGGKQRSCISSVWQHSRLVAALHALQQAYLGRDVVHVVAAAAR